MARHMVALALDAGVSVGWVNMDEAYGQAKSLRAWLEERDVSYVNRAVLWSLHQNWRGSISEPEEIAYYVCQIKSSPRPTVDRVRSRSVAPGRRGEQDGRAPRGS
jgi:hypothetical protein